MLDVLETNFDLGVWENEGGPAAFSRPAPLPVGIPFRAPRHGLPRFLNDVGSAIVEIGVRAFNCIGATPPADHPHIYLDMGISPSILCPYCSTRFRFDPALRDGATRPPGCWHDDC